MLTFILYFRLAFLFGFMVMYFAAVELNSNTSSTAEVLVFRRGHVPAYMQNVDKADANDEELGAAEKATATDSSDATDDDVKAIPPQTDMFTWRDVDYDIEIKGETRRLLDHVSGFVKPGTLTALMGTSGAGKTTLLDVSRHRRAMLETETNPGTGFGSTNDYGSGHWKYVCERSASGCQLSAQDWIRPTAGFAFGHRYSP